MATITNKRKHDLECNGVLLHPGENAVDDEVWKQANTEGSQLRVWSKLNWIAERRSLPVAKDVSPTTDAAAGATFHAPSVDTPVSEQPGGTMNPSAASEFPELKSAGPDTEDTKRRRR